MVVWRVLHNALGQHPSMEKKMSKILTMLATAAVLAITLALPADAGPRGAGGYSMGGHWSPYGPGEGSPQIDGAG